MQQINNTKNGRKLSKNRGAPTAISSLVRSEVARAISSNNRRMDEVKHSITTFTDINPAYPTALLQPTLIDLRATISKGSGSQNRVGTHIRLTKYTFSVSAWMPSTATVTPCVMRFIFCKLRGSPTTTPTLAQINCLKRTNTDSVTTGIYSSTKTTQLTPYNSELWEVLSTRDLKLGLAAPFGSSTGTPNNDFNLEMSFVQDMTSFLKRDIQFDDSAPTNPNIQVSDGLFLLVMCLDYQEAVGIASATTPRFDAAVSLEFVDP